MAALLLVGLDTDMLKDVLARIHKRLELLKMTETSAARDAGLSVDAIRNIRRAVEKGNDSAGVSSRTINALAPVLKTTSAWLLDEVGPEEIEKRTVPIVGRAGASTDGRVVYAEGQGTQERVLIPEGASEDSSAIEIEGYSMGFLADGALIFYSERHDAPTDDMLGLIVVVGLDDGSVLLKRLLRGSETGLYDLESINGPTMRDRRVVWAAHIDSVVPPWRAKRLRVDPVEATI